MKLRKCKVEFFNTKTKKTDEFIGYFHGWTNDVDTKIHPDNPSKDLYYSYMVAVVENIDNGEVTEETPSSITFIL